MTRYKIIVNPTSGRGAGGAVIPVLEAELGRLRIDYDLVQTQAPRHAIDIARQAASDGYDVVVSVGGDGTANEVLNGLMQAKQAGEGKSRMGLIPIGRGNDFAFGVMIPVELEQACKTLLDGHGQWIDVGFVKGGDFPEGRYFGNGIGIGFDAVVGFEALKMKRLHGFPSYLVAAIKTIYLYYKAPAVRIEYDGESFELPALMVSIMNGRRMGGGFMMAPEAETADGYLDICIAREVSKAGIFALIPRFMAGSQANHPAISTLRTRSIEVTALAGSLPAHADGETLCFAGEALAIEIIPRQIFILSAPVEVVA
ncbi:MAG: diacylglycerol kinase family lipid kinase [Anaerolineales bacterium]|nr:diacylglycerol kinase family lipid kinase [Anaerolineales bacterium]